MTRALLSSPAAGHEPDQVPTGAIIVTVAVLMALLAGVGALVWRVLPDPRTPLPVAHFVQDMPARNDWGDAGREQLRRLRERESVNLGSYQWLDQNHAGVRIPIERAMELLAQRSTQAGQPR